MDGLTLQEWVTLILRGHFETARVDAPQLSMGDYATIVRGALSEHGVDPLSSRVSEIVRAEGFEPMYARVPRRCGASCGKRLFVPPGLPPGADAPTPPPRTGARLGREAGRHRGDRVGRVAADGGVRPPAVATRPKDLPATGLVHGIDGFYGTLSAFIAFHMKRS